MKRIYMKAIRFLSVISAIVFVIISLTACQPEKNNQAEPTAQIETTNAAEKSNIYDMENYESDEVFDFVKVNQGGKYDEFCTTYQFNYLSDGLKIEGCLVPLLCFADEIAKKNPFPIFSVMDRKKPLF